MHVGSFLAYGSQAVVIKAGFRSALFNLALLLTDDGRPSEATPYLQTLVYHHPDHVKGLILLGDIYINHLKDLNAAEKVSKYKKKWMKVGSAVGDKMDKISKLQAVTCRPWCKATLSTSRGSSCWGISILTHLCPPFQHLLSVRLRLSA